MEPNEYAAGAGQKGMERRADQRVRDFCKTFNEIQTGPNPLTPVGPYSPASTVRLDLEAPFRLS